MKLLALAVTLLALAAAPLAPAAQAATPRRCADVENPYAGSKYDGADLSRIRATKVSCTTARRIARRAHRKALGMTPTGPIRRLTYDGWRVRGDLRGDDDAYTATKGSRRITWRF